MSKIKIALEKRLDEIFGKFIRVRDFRKGCITCGCPLTYETATCGHYMKRRHKATRWSELNCNGQCWPCNHSDDDALYRSRLVNLIGEAQVQDLERLAHNYADHSISDLNDLITKFKILLHEARK